MDSPFRGVVEAVLQVPGEELRSCKELRNQNTTWTRWSPSSISAQHIRDHEAGLLSKTDLCLDPDSVIY